MKRFGLICGVVGTISGIVSAIALRIQLESAATAFNKLASASQASVSSGFDRKLQALLNIELMIGQSFGLAGH